MNEFFVIPATKRMLPFLMEADSQHFDDPWDELRWLGILSLAADENEKESVSVAVEQIGPNQLRMHGFSVWHRSDGEKMRLAKIAVQPTARRNRVGLILANRPWEKETPLIAEVPERNLLAQKFFRGCGWVGAMHGPADKNGDRTIRFSTTGGCGCNSEVVKALTATDQSTSLPANCEIKLPKEKN